MKPKFNLLIALFLFLGIAAVATEEDAIKEIHESWPATSVQTLNIVNKYGDVKIENKGGSEVTIDVIISVEASSESRAKKMLEMIDVDFSKSGNKITAETDIEDNFKSRDDFSIDYTVNIPTDKNLIIENKFGNVVLNELNAKGDFIIKYGNLTANLLNGVNADDINIVLEYGKANIETISSAKMTVKYSKIFLDQINDLMLESKYSTFTIDKMKSVKFESKYDTFNFDEVAAVSGTTKYSHIKIDELLNSLKIESGYGGISVDEVSASFEMIDITNSYGAINLGISDEAVYNVDVSCDYCGIKYNDDNFMGNRETEDHTKSIIGKIGDGEPKGKVSIKSRYGSIKLQD